MEQRARDRLIRALLKLSRRAHFATDVRRATERFWGPGFAAETLDDALAAMSPEWAATMFLDWLLCDFRLADGQTIVDHFVERHRATLDAFERSYLQQLSRSCISLYEIEDVRPEQGFTMRDLFRGGTVPVRERLATRSLVRWDIVATRLIDSGGEKVINASVIPFRVQDREPLLRRLRYRYTRYRKDHPGASPEAFLKDSAEFFNHYVQEVLALPPPQLITAEGDPVHVCRAYYQIEDRPAVLAALRQVPELEEMDPGSYAWLEAGDPRGPRSLGKVEVGERELELWCMSKERLVRGKALLERHAGSHLIHRVDAIQDPWVAAALAGPQEEPSAIPPDVEAAAYQAYLDDHYRRWIDQPVPFLSGLTPRQAVATPGGRKRVAALLRGIENREARHRLERGFGYDAAWMWRELGLDPLV